VCLSYIFSSFLDPWLNFFDGQIPHFADGIWWCFCFFWMVEWWTGFGKIFLDQRLITLKNKLINQ
jgi:hypothetical protein